MTETTTARKHYAHEQVLQCVIMLEIALQSMKVLSEGINEHPEIGNKITGVIGHMVSMKKTLIGSYQKDDPEFAKSLAHESRMRDKMWDISQILALLSKIGTGEKSENYEEFLSLLTTCFDKVFYAETNRKNLNFGKYKALFELIAEEIKNDVNRTPNRIHYSPIERSLYFRAIKIESPVKIQEHV